MEKLCTSQTFLKIVYIKWWEGTYSSSYPPGSVPGHQLQKPSKESDIFQLLNIFNFVIFYQKADSKGGGGIVLCSLNTFLLPIYSCKVTLLNVRGKY